MRTAKKFEFFYKVLDYSGTREVRTRHRLVGTDEDWVVGKGGGVGGGSPDAANRRPTTKIAIPPKMNGVSVTGT